MSIIKAYYHDGEIDFIERPSHTKSTNVFVIFPANDCEIRKLRGSMKSPNPIDYNQIATDLHKLSTQSASHIAEDVQQGPTENG